VVSDDENDLPILPAYETKTPSMDGNYDDEYRVPHVVNITQGPPSGGRSGISAESGGRRARRELGTNRKLPERRGMSGIRDATEERPETGGRKQIKILYDILNITLRE
jgi:hypothetical protein